MFYVKSVNGSRFSDERGPYRESEEQQITSPKCVLRWSQWIGISCGGNKASICRTYHCVDRRQSEDEHDQSKSPRSHEGLSYAISSFCENRR